MLGTYALSQGFSAMLLMLLLLSVLPLSLNLKEAMTVFGAAPAGG
jgi:hypothetical protein